MIDTRYSFINPSLIDTKHGLIREITEWLPDFDDPQVAVAAALTCNTSELGVGKVGSTLNSGAGTCPRDAV